MGSVGHDRTWRQDLHGGATFRPLLSNDDAEEPPVSKLLASHHVSAFTPVEHQWSIDDQQDPLVKVNDSSRQESPRLRRLYAAGDKYHTADSIHKYDFRMDVADQVDFTKCVDSFGEQRGRCLPIRTKRRAASFEDSSSVRDQDLKQLSRSELEAKLEEAQTALNNMSSSSKTSPTGALDSDN
ncbi:uncharacterized protein [Antedon mediterranea]|uniref:uncharacterized protein n=1 Tax=Antedon mediterranea TaxID=105859 RepID=UPI003AF5441E